MGLANSLDDTSNAFQPASEVELDLNFEDLDDDEIDTYIMNEDEFQCKQELWYQRNAEFLEEQKGKVKYMYLTIFSSLSFIHVHDRRKIYSPIRHNHIPFL